MDYVWYLFRFDGRINRARCWQAATMPKSVNFGLNDIFNILDPQAWRSLSSANFTALFIQTVGTLLFLWVYLATSVKRLHDRDKSGWWMLLFFVMPGLYSQFGGRLEEDSWFAFLMGTNALVFSVWGFVEMYCLKGSKGTNRFGTDPLAPPDRRPGWDQQSELEFVPTSAGPSDGPHVKRGHE
jgi:uncharacterized membrane protein YhaH (DUF805 family)